MKKTLLTIPTLLALVTGCSSPLDGPGQGPVLDEKLSGVIDREMQTVSEWETDLGSERPPSQVEEELAHRMEELEGLVPVPDGSDLDFTLGIDLNGEPQKQVPVDLQDAVRMALQNNLLLQNARLQPAIQREQVIQAEAVFDVVLGGGYSFTKTRTPLQRTDVTEIDTLFGGGGNIDVNPSVSNVRTNDAEVSLSKQLTTGGQVELTSSLQRINTIGDDGVRFYPNPYWQPSLTLDFSQPILRGFGEKVNLAQVYISQKLEQEAIEQMRQSLIDTVANTEIAYWNLALAWRSLGIQLWLVEASIELRDIVNLRRGYDASLADWAQAVAVVEQRLADVIGFQLSVKEASDQLKVLINDPRFPLAGETVLAPIDEMIHTPIVVDLRSALLVAVSMRPDVRQSIYEIEIAQIEEVVADNGRLPELDFQAQVSTTGMSKDFDDSYDRAYGGDFISYVLGLTFEYPLGNRAAEAAWREQRLERSAAMVNYRTSIQTAILDVKTAMRDVIANSELIDATRNARLATAEYLRSLEVERETIATLTPTFLNLIFQAQASLASARTSEFQAIVDFNTSVVDLYTAMGTILDMHQIGIETLDEHSFWGSSLTPYPSGNQ